MTEINPAYRAELAENWAVGTAVPAGERWLAVATTGYTEDVGTTGRLDLALLMAAPVDGTALNDTLATFEGLAGGNFTDYMVCDDETEDAATSYVYRGQLLSPKTVDPDGTLEFALSNIALLARPGS